MWGGPPAWGLGERLTTPRRKETTLLRNVRNVSDLLAFFGTI